MAPRASTAVLLALLLVPGCRSRDDSPSAPAFSASVVVSSSPTTSAPPPPMPSASAVAPARLSPTLSDLQARASDAPPWPSGPGVTCGEQRCAAGELCCDGAGERRCLPKSRVNECLEARSVAMECDESSDCAAGQICCYGIIYEKEARLVACKTPAACAVPLSAPGSFPFPGVELCARGGSCRDPRLVCIDDDGMPSGGRCVSKIGSVACPGKGTCSGERPWCLWDPGTRTAECIPRGPWEREEGVVSCDGPEDCVGEPCCAAGSRAFCSMDCTEAFRFTPEICHRDADCSPRGRAKCVTRDASASPGSKECR